MAIAQLLRQMKEFQRAVDLLDAGLKLVPGDQQLLDLKVRIAIEGSLWKPAVAGLSEQLAHDSALGKDTTWLNTAIGAAQSAPDTQALLRFTEVAVRNFPTSIRFLKARGGAFEMAGVVDSAVIIYKKTLALEQGNDVTLSLLIAKTIVDHAQYDTTQARILTGRKDTIALRALQQAFGEKVDSARPFLHPGLVSTDTAQKLTAAVLMLTGGSKIAQAAAYDRSYIWLDTLLQVVAPRTPTDTTGPRFQVRINASFWFGLSSILTLGPTYKAITQLPASDRQRCDKAKVLVFDRLDRTRAALNLGRRVHPPTADQMLGFVAQYEKGRAPVKAAFKCRNF
jgi:tetratricopeptide (TPR) repeat protein